MNHIIGPGGCTLGKTGSIYDTEHRYPEKPTYGKTPATGIVTTCTRRGRLTLAKMGSCNQGHAANVDVVLPAPPKVQFRGYQLKEQMRGNTSKEEKCPRSPICALIQFCRSLAISAEVPLAHSRSQPLPLASLAMNLSSATVRPRHSVSLCSRVSLKNAVSVSFIWLLLLHFIFLRSTSGIEQMNTLVKRMAIVQLGSCHHNAGGRLIWRPIRKEASTLLLHVSQLTLSLFPFFSTLFSETQLDRIEVKERSAVTGLRQCQWKGENTMASQSSHPAMPRLSNLYPGETLDECMSHDYSVLWLQLSVLKAAWNNCCSQLQGHIILAISVMP